MLARYSVRRKAVFFCLVTFLGIIGNACRPGAAQTYHRIQISNNADDGFFDTSNGTGWHSTPEDGSADWVGAWGGTANAWVAGYRFPATGINSGDTIQSAYIELVRSTNDASYATCGTEPCTNTSFTIRVYGVAQDNGAAFSGTAGNTPLDVPYTTAFTDYLSTGPGDVHGSCQGQNNGLNTCTQFIDVTNIVKEITSRPGWTSSSAIRFVVLNTDSSSPNFRRGFEDSADNAAQSAALLVNPPLPTIVSSGAWGTSPTGAGNYPTSYPTGPFVYPGASTLLLFLGDYYNYFGGGLSTPPTVADSCGNNWNTLAGPKDYQADVYDMRTTVYYVQNPASCPAGDTITVTPNLNEPIFLHFFAVAGSQTPIASSITDPGTPGLYTTTATTGPVTLANSGLLISWAFGDSDSMHTFTPQAGFTTDLNSTPNYLTAAYENVAAGTYTNTFSISPSDGWQTVLVGLTPSGGGGGGTTPPTITSASTASGTVGTAFSYQITATQSPTGYNATGLPAGLGVNTSTGLISGTPTGAGASTVTLSATNGGGTTTATLTITIAAGAPTITSASTASGTVGTAFSYQISATNSPTGYNATGLPAGLGVNTSTGLISGTPAGAGASTVTLSATNGSGTGTETLTITIAAAGAPVITSATTASGTIGSAFSYQITATNSPTSYNATGLPAGLSVNTSTGVVSGKPATAGGWTVTLSATNGGGTGMATLTITIGAGGVPSIAFVQESAAATSAAGKTLSVSFVGNTLPGDLILVGFDLSSTATPVSVTDSQGNTFTQVGTQLVTPGASASRVYYAKNISGGPDSVTITLSANSGIEAYLTEYSGVDPTSPIDAQAGASGTAGAVSSGTAQTSIAGDAIFGYCAGDSACTVGSGFTARSTFNNNLIEDAMAGSPGPYAATAMANNGWTMQMVALRPASGTTAAPVITSSSAASGTVGTAFSYQITATQSPTGYNATGLPAGLGVNTSTGLISGTPTGAGTSTATLSATNGGGTTTATLTITIAAGAPTITSASTASGTIGSAFSYQITATNSPTSYNATGLPAGLGVNTSTGLISGTPTGVGTSTVTLSATNSTGTGTSALSLTVTSQMVPAITWLAPTAITYGTQLSTTQLDATSSVQGMFAYNPALGTLLGAGTHTLSVTFTPNDTTNYTTATQTVQIAVEKAPQTIAFQLPSNASLAAGTLALSATGGASGNPIAFSVVSGPGSINGNSLVFAGTGTIVVAADQAGSANYLAAAQITQSVTVVSNPILTVVANDATRVYGAANPAFTGSITGAVSGDVFTESFSTAATATSNVGTYPIVPSAAGTNLAAYSEIIQNGTLTITKAGSTVSLSASTSGGSSPMVTLTATVSPATTGIPTGTVTFFDGAVQLGSATLSSGTASFATSSFASGTTHSLTAAYSGDGNFVSSTTPTPVIYGGGDFTLAVAGASSATVTAGSPASYQLTATPTSGNYPGTVTFSAAGLPAGATVSFNPSSIASGAGQQTVTATIQTSAVTGMNLAPAVARGLAKISLAFLLVPFLGIRRMRCKLDRMLMLIVLLGGAGVISALSGCGAGGVTVLHPSQSYNVTITANGGGLQHSVMVTLTLQ